ncbi:MAG: hypothetical protein QW250_07850 [Sulfolobaceae archaeon]
MSKVRASIQFSCDKYKIITNILNVPKSVGRIEGNKLLLNFDNNSYLLSIYAEYNYIIFNLEGEKSRLLLEFKVAMNTVDINVQYEGRGKLSNYRNLKDFLDEIIIKILQNC